MMESLLQDLRFALRGLRRSPGFAAVAVLTLALGIGANSAMFSVASSFLWEPAPVTRPDELVNIFEHRGAGDDYGDLPWADYLDMRERREAFADVIAYYPYPFALSEGGRNERTWGEFVSGNYFAMLGVQPSLGRALSSADAVAGAAPVAVISDGLWRGRFRAAPSVVGSIVKLNGQAFTIVGVAPPEFHSMYYVGFHPRFWVPAGQMTALFPGNDLAARDGPNFRMLARLAPGVSVARAQAAVATVMARLSAEYSAKHAGRQAVVLREREARPEPSIAGPFALAAKLFLVAVGLVLMIACANVANLLLARAAGRRREIAVRLAVGASRGRLVRQLLVESLLLASIGAVLGVGLAAWAGSGLTSLLRLPTDIPFAFDFRVNGAVVGYTAVLALLAGAVFGLVPALQAVRPELTAALKNDAPVRGLSRARLGSALVVGQIAMSCVLLIVSGLAVRTLQQLRGVNPGFDAGHGLLVGVSPELQRYNRPRGEQFFAELQRRVAALPLVRAASVVQWAPFDFSSNGGPLFVAGHEKRPGADGVESAGSSNVLPGFFAALGVELAEGRDFTARDDSSAPAVAIVNQTLVRRYWPDGNAIGKQLRINTADAPLMTVVGVAPDMKYGNLNEPPRPFVYVAITQSYAGTATLLVRTAGDPHAAAASVTAVIAALDPEMPADVRTYDQLMAGRALLLPRFAATLAGAFGALAFVLAVVGLYGIVSYTVSQRVREMGIRVALGARPATVVRMVVRGGLAQAGLGIGIGLVAALGATRALKSLLFGVGAADLATFASVAVTLAAVAALASWIPARRAARVDPMVALRSE
jgi:predicted permease